MQLCNKGLDSSTNVKTLLVAMGRLRHRSLNSKRVDIYIFLFFTFFQVLKNEFPKGVDIIYESVGGKMFDLCLNALAVYGRLIVIGMISQVVY